MFLVLSVEIIPHTANKQYNRLDNHPNNDKDFHFLLAKVTMFVIQMKNALRGLSAPAAWQTPEKFFI